MYIVKTNLKDQLASIEAGPSDAPKEHEWIYWVYSYLWNGKNMKQEDRRRTIANFWFRKGEVIGFERLDLVCLQTFTSIQEYKARDIGRTYVRVNDGPIGHSDSLHERWLEDQYFTKLFLANICYATGWGISSGWADTLTEALLNEKTKNDTFLHCG
jgi:hypothetical protein